MTGELTGFKRSRVQAFFELRDSQGALPCSIWNTDLEKLGLDPKLLADGAEVVIGGGLDYYPGSANASPSFNFRATHMRLAGDGDLLARLAAPPRGAQARRPLRAAEAARPPGAAEDDRRRHRARERGVPGPPGRARAARLARDDRVGGRAGAGPPRGAADRVGAARPRRARAGRGRGGVPGRRLARRPVGVLRREPVPDGRAPAAAGHLSASATRWTAR